MDGADLGKISFENLNSAEARITVTGTSMPPWPGKKQVKNAILMAIELQNMLPPAETPSHTEGYEGFYHLMEFRGDVEQAVLVYKVSDFEQDRFDARKGPFARCLRLPQRRVRSRHLRHRDQGHYEEYAPGCRTSL